MSPNTTRSRSRGVLAVAATVVLVVSAVAAGVSLTAGTASAAPTGIDDCTVVDEPGTYELTRNVTRTRERGRESYPPCIRIRASDVVLDGNGYTVESVYTALGVDHPDGIENVTVRNVRVFTQNRAAAMRVANVTGGVAANVTVDGRYEGLLVTHSEDVTLRDSFVAAGGFTIRAGNATVVDNRVDGYLYGSGVYGDNAVVRNNTVEASVGGIQGYYPALHVEGRDNLVVDNTVPPAENGAAEGLSIDGTNATVRNNTAISGSEFVPDYPLTGLSVAGRNHTVVDNRLGGFSGPGIELDGSNHTVHGNVVGDTDVGIEVESRNSLIYDNRLSGGDAVSFPYRYYDPDTDQYETSDPQRNAWNVSARSGENVLGGNTVGGNYYVDTDGEYANFDGIGFSEACADEDDDGICDFPNAVAYNNTDHLPLADEGNMSVAYFEVADIVASGRLDADGETTVTANVTNVGTRSDTQTVVLKAGYPEYDTRRLDNRTVTLDPGETATLTFDAAFDRTGTEERLTVDSADSNISKTVTPFLADGNGSEPNVTTYQVDFVAGQPIENLSADRLYAQEDRLMRFAFGNASAGITRKDTAWPKTEIRQCVDYGHIRERANGTAAVRFSVAAYCEDVTLTLAVYETPGMAFFPETADQQVLLNATTGTYGPGEHTITADLPDGNETDG